MPKNTEWTYRPKYTKARIAKELADKEQELTSTLTDLLRVQTLEGAKMKDIVFECFVQMLEEFKLAREQIADCMDGNWDPMDFFFATYCNTDTYAVFMKKIRDYIYGIDECARERESEEMAQYIKEGKEDVA